ncbi:MAG: kelch repeat-containing protein [Planctomycetota bacterium]
MKATLLPLFAALALASAAPGAPQRVGCVWDRLADSPIGRFEAVTMPIDGKLYCFGGFFTQTIRASARVDFYDPLTDTWTRRFDMPAATTHVGFVRDGRDVWILGGFEGDNPGVATADVWIFDIDANRWSAGPSLPRPIAAGACALIGRDLHYYGGCEADRDTMTGDHWVLDLDAQQLGWQPLAPMPQPRCHLSGAALNGEIWAIGGQFNHDTNPLDTRWVHVYDPQTDTWRQGPLLPEARSHFEPGTFVRNGNLYIAAGKDLTRGLLAVGDMLELDPVLETWTLLPPLPEPVYGAGVQPIGDLLYAANGATFTNVPRTTLYRRDWAAQLPDPLRINCGGPEVVASTGTCCWCGDIGFMNGESKGYNPNANVQGTDDQVLFDRQRRGVSPNRQNVDYRLPLGPGFYRVTFFLAERQTMNVGARELDLLIEGEPYIEDLDLLDVHGFEVAVEYAYDIVVEDEALDIRIQARSGQRAVVAAIEVERLDQDHFAFECTSAPNSTGSATTIDFLGTTSVGRDELQLLMGPVPATTFGLFIQAENAGNVPLAGGTLCVAQPFFRLPIEQAVGLDLQHRLQIGSPPSPIQQIVAGSTWRFQGWYRDVLVPARYGLSDAVKLVFTP